MEVKEISVETLKEWRQGGKEHQLIDVRESYEIEIAEIQGQHIPLAELPANLNGIRDDIAVVFIVDRVHEAHAQCNTSCPIGPKSLTSIISQEVFLHGLIKLTRA